MPTYRVTHPESLAGREVTAETALSARADIRAELRKTMGEGHWRLMLQLELECVAVERRSRARPEPTPEQRARIEAERAQKQAAKLAARTAKAAATRARKREERDQRNAERRERERQASQARAEAMALAAAQKPPWPSDPVERWGLEQVTAHDPGTGAQRFGRVMRFFNLTYEQAADKLRITRSDVQRLLQGTMVANWPIIIEGVRTPEPWKWPR